MHENASCFSARQRYEKGSNGIVGTMHMLLFHDNFIKPWSAEYKLLCLLTCSFLLWCVLCLYELPDLKGVKQNK